MILPDKDIRLNNSVLYCGYVILKSFSDSESLPMLWEKFRGVNSFWAYEKFILTLDFLYAVGLIEFENDLIVRCDNGKN